MVSVHLPMNESNYFIPIFWDQPQFRSAEKLREVLLSGDASLRRWILLRFLQS